MLYYAYNRHTWIYEELKDEIMPSATKRMAEVRGKVYKKEFRDLKEVVWKTEEERKT